MFKRLFILLTITFACSVNAAPVSYSYVSGALNISDSGAVPEVTNITLNFTADLLGDVNDDDISSLVSSWQITDGITLTGSFETDYRLDFLIASTDSSGRVTDFRARVIKNKLFTDIAYGEHYLMQMFFDPAGGTRSVEADSYYCKAFVNDSCNSGQRTFSDSVTGGAVSEVPLPGAFGLFSLSLAGLGWSKRKKA